MPELGPQLRQEYREMFETCVLRDDEYWKSLITGATHRVRRAKIRYQAVAITLSIPWQWIGAMHLMESEGDFTKHLHNNDPLTKRTVNAPAGRPPLGHPPFYWHQSALDALIMRELDQGGPWDIARMLFEAERWGGFSYRNRGVVSPYLWAGSLFYEKGLYVEDCVWAPDASAWLPGIGVVLKSLFQFEPIDEPS